ncbi:CBS domain-containing protein [Nocardia sp. NPDC003963]
MRARDILSRPVITVRPDTLLPDAVALLTGHGFAALPVVDDSERVVGILSESDAMTAPPGTATVDSAMTVPVEVVGPAADTATIAGVALDHHVRSIPVVEAGVLVGIVSRRDLLRALLCDETTIEASVRSVLDDYAGSHRQWDIEAADGTVTVQGIYADETEQRTVAALARTVPGVAEVRIVDIAATAAPER